MIPANCMGLRNPVLSIHLESFLDPFEFKAVKLFSF